MKYKNNKFIPSILIFTLVLFTSGILPLITDAASLVNAKDTMSTQALGANSDHTLTWTLAAGHTTALNATIAIHFVPTDFITSVALPPNFEHQSCINYQL